ncbi:MAG: hypothetical protein QXN93_03590 [Methanomassiliicoccales archaeon]
MNEVLKQDNRSMGGKLWDLVCQVIESSRNPLDVIREQLSNCCAEEVGAENVKVIFYDDPTYRASFIISDDGCGMNLTNDPQNPGRLDKFLDIAVSRHAGVKTDEFGYKGLGAKLAMNCKRLELKTKHKETGQSTLVYVDDPMSYLRRNEPPNFKIVPNAGLNTTGTEVKILGYSSGEVSNIYKFDNIRKYLFFRTIVGHTKPRKMPRISLRTPEKEELLKTGFPYLRPPKTPNWKTYVLEEPIVVDQRGSNGLKVRVTLKGGYSLDTGDQNITGEYTLSGDRTGLFLSIKGIPYIRLDINEFRSTFSTIQYKFCRFVAECDEIADYMDFARGYFIENEVTSLFGKGLRECFDILADRPETKTFLKERERDRHIRQRESLDARKAALESPEQRYVFLKKGHRRLHRVPDNEKDTLALLWKLEALQALPFDFFETLEHTNLEGIDILANIRTEKDAHTQKLIPVEVEDTFEEYIPHGHSANQTEMIICWEIENPDSLEKSSEKRYLYFVKIGDRRIPVYEMSSFPEIEISKV